MGTQYRCGSERRRQQIGQSTTINGIDYLEVSADQRTLEVHFFHNLPGEPGAVPPSEDPLTENNVVIEGGVRVTDVRVEPFESVADNVLTVVVNEPGDFSTYGLRLISLAEKTVPPDGFDPQLSEVEFSFKADCPNEFDRGGDRIYQEPNWPSLQIDYLAKDYASFRQLMLDRLAAIMPDWQERNPADLGITLVELLAYAADHLSYYQDAVATEAYLGTARKRTSVRRHTRLLDYPMHDGCNARTWVQVCVEDASGGVSLKKDAEHRTQFLTSPPEVAEGTQVEEALNEAAGTDETETGEARVEASVQAGEVFEPLLDADQYLYPAHNEIRFYTWGNEECYLPAGATSATLCRQTKEGLIEHLSPGDVLIFEEAKGPASGREGDADPLHRQAVRLTEVRFDEEDPLFFERDTCPLPPGASDDAQKTRVVEIGWALEDALPFPLCLSRVINNKLVKDISVARGNVVLADHGLTVTDRDLASISDGGLYRLKPLSEPLTQQGRVHDRHNDLVPFDPEAPASAALRGEMRYARPVIELLDNDSQTWRPQRDLLSTDRFANEFVVETEEDGSAYLRFGVPPLGRAPASILQATYRVGNGRRGNVGAGTINHVVTNAEGIRRNVEGIRSVRNPLPAQGGTDPEPLEQIRLYAPQAFRYMQERAVTEADYATVAQRHPEVQRAAATRRWSGSWYTWYLTVDRKGGLPVDEDFEGALRRFLERFRLAGYDLEIEGPLFVPLDVALTVCVEPGYLRANVKRTLLETFSSGYSPEGQRGFFHPDNFTFGQPVYLSRIVAAAMEVPGVSWVDPVRFHRWGEEPRGELTAGRITLGRLEIARLDNDPNAPENGKVEFDMRGGL